MIAIVLDTNILHNSPYLSRDEWVSLSTHKDEWKVRILVPRVVVMETTNTVTRGWTAEKNGFSKAKVAVFDLQKEVETIVHTIDTRIKSYEDDLRKRLFELGAEILPDPTVSHTKVAERAAKRTAPYQEKADKDNYRDTIIWLSVIEVAKDNPGHEVWFVSDNHTDFGTRGSQAAEVSREFHPGLQKELGVLGLEDRVKYATSLAALVQHIASVYGPLEAEERARLMAAVKYDVLTLLLNEQILAMTIPARDVALDPTVSIAVVSEVLSPKLEWKFSDEAKAGEREWTANYVVDLETVVLGYSRDVEESLSTDSKVLRASGTVTFTTEGNIEKFEVARLEALPNDPNRGIWELLDLIGYGERSDVGTYLADRLRGGFDIPLETKDAMRKATQQAISPETKDAMRKATPAAAEQEASGQGGSTEKGPGQELPPSPES